MIDFQVIFSRFHLSQTFHNLHQLIFEILVFLWKRQTRVNLMGLPLGKKQGDPVESFSVG